MSLRTISAFEAEENMYPYRVYAPTEEQYTALLDRQVHGEIAMPEQHPELDAIADIQAVLHEKPELADICDFDIDQVDSRIINCINEHLAGPALSIRDFAILSAKDIWHEKDKKHLMSIRINEFGCWEMPKYVDDIKPGRARYPQPYTYSAQHGDVRKQMGAAWMWERTVGPLPDDVLPNDRRRFWPDHRCNNKACVYPRHIVLGTPEANDAFTARMDILEKYNEWIAMQWTRPSFAYPDGIEHIVHESEVRLLSHRSVILPVAMSKREFDAAKKALLGRGRLPDGGYTTDPGYHVLKSALGRGLDFDEETGCWNARIDLDTLPPHKQTITHPCGSERCCNPRHMDITETHKKYYELQTDDYITAPDGKIINKKTGEILPPYWESWMLYWNWLRENSVSTAPGDEERLLSDVDFSHIWVHPLTGCWENERFYPRWSSNGSQQNAYGFHRSSYGEYGRSAHRYLLYKYLEYIGAGVEVDMTKDADHCCDNRRCCNPLHMQFRNKKEHAGFTISRRDDVSRKVAQLVRLRRLGHMYR